MSPAEANALISARLKRRAAEIRATEPLSCLPDADDLQALVAVIETALWSDHETARGVGTALLALIGSLATATEDALDGGFTAERFREFVGPSLANIAEQIANIETWVARTVAAIGHA